MLNTRATIASILRTHLQVLLSRLERDPHYGFVDTKFSTLDGHDFPDTDPIRGRQSVYGWIQARALEALAEHGRWLQSDAHLGATQHQNPVKRLKDALPQLVERTLAVRSRTGGHLPFVFRPDGTPLAVEQSGALRPAPPPPASTYGDLFLAKGLIAAGAFLSNPELREQGFTLLTEVLTDIETNRFRSNQQPLRPPHRSNWTSCRQEEGPWMIALGALELAYRESQNPEWLTKAISFIRRLTERHLNLGQFPELAFLDFVETLTPDGQPLIRSGRIVCVPGHVLEFVGLSAKILLRVRAVPSLPEKFQRTVRRVTALLPELFLHTFELGYQPEPGGIVASVDLTARRPLDANLPWWAVPEALRAAELVLHLDLDPQTASKLAEARNRLLGDLLVYWVNPKAHFWLFQTRDAAGNPLDSIPATPDADPAYHTGLSLLDLLEPPGQEI